MSHPASETAAIRARLAADRARCRELHEGGQGGGAVVRAHTRAVDRAITALARFYLPGPDRITLLAVGGYGRGELAFASDIDLLLLHDDPDPETTLTPFLTALWDMGWDLGHQVLTPADACDLAASDSQTLTSYLEARLLRGSPRAFTDFAGMLRREVFGPRREAWCAGKVGELEARHAQAGETVYLSEPDVKESPGGLRDVHTLLWLSRAREGPHSWPEYLAEQAGGSRQEERLLRARDHSLWVRNALHLHRARKWDRLDHRSQEELARIAGTEGCRGRLPVEVFMQEYYRAVWSIFTFTRLQLAAGGYAPDRPRLAFTRALAPEGEEGENWPFDELTARPLALLDRLLALARSGGRIAPETAEHLLAGGENLGRAAAGQAEHGSLLMALLEEPRAAATLRLMHDYGILGALLPEFARLRALVQFDPYHSYTADEHTLRALDALEDLVADDCPARESEIGRDLATVRDLVPLAAWAPTRRDAALLRLALLYHDIAKGTGAGGHAERGARMVRKAGLRLGLDDGELRDVTFLVRHHLLLSGTAQRRDFTEEILLTRLQRIIRTPRRLHLLALLTLCDMAALGSSVLTRWKAGLLAELIAGVERIMAGDRITSRRERIAELLIDLPDDERDHLETWLAGMPAEYLADVDGESLQLEAGLFREWHSSDRGRDAVAFRVGHDRDLSRLSCITVDRAGLLSRICGLLAAHDITILQARIFTRLDGAIVDRFMVADADRGGTITAGQEEAVNAQLAAAVTGELDIEGMLAAHAERWRLRDRPRMSHPVSLLWDPAASDRYSVLEIRAADRVGLLHDLALTMTLVGVAIHQAFISTEGERAVDAFYLTDPLGAPLDDSARELLRQKLTDLLTA